MDGSRKALTLFIISAVVLSVAYSLYTGYDLKRHYRFTQPAMGTTFHIDCYGVSEDIASNASKTAFALLHEIEAALTRFRDDSEVSTINKNPAGPNKMSRPLAECVKASIKAAEMSGGYFDITFMPLYKLWDWRNSPSKIPDDAAIKAALSKVGYSKIKIDFKDMSMRMDEGMMIDLGGIAKGYAVGKMAGVVTSLGVSDAIIEGGGDLCVTAERPYVIGIQDPFNKSNGKIAGRLVVNGPVSVFTSGDYEQFAVIGGKNYGHIIDPKTGYPAEGPKSATIIGADPTLTDGLATALIAMGMKKAVDFAKNEKLATVLIDHAGNIAVSEELEKKARFVKE